MHMFVNEMEPWDITVKVLEQFYLLISFIMWF